MLSLLNDHNLSADLVAKIVASANGDESQLAEICDRVCDIASYLISAEWPGTADMLGNNPTTEEVDACVNALRNLGAEYRHDLARMEAVKVAVDAYDAALSGISA